MHLAARIPERERDASFRGLFSLGVSRAFVGLHFGEGLLFLLLGRCLALRCGLIHSRTPSKVAMMLSSIPPRSGS